jgi:hypothetical protein
MRRPIRVGLAILLSFCVASVSAQEKTAETPVFAVVESSLKTDGKQVRQFAFDGAAETYFASKDNPTKEDQFTLVFDKPVAVKAVEVLTGKPKGDDALESGILEVSTDGKKFEEAAKFAEGKANAKLDGKMIRAVRIRPTDDMKHPLAVREFTVDSEPKVTTFKHPVEFVVDVSDAPEMKDWAEKAARVCERQYPMICEELRSDGFKPLTVISMTLKSNYNGVAATGGGRITGSAKYFKAHEDDIGAMVHETVHAVQLYGRAGGGARNPGWLVEGVADYIRFYKYEPGKLRKLAPERAKYDGSYQTTARFLAFVTEKYDKELVRKLNAAMREGKYKEELWKEITGKTVEELGQEWKKSLAD